MSRKMKNILMSIILVLLVGASILTMYLAGSSIQSTTTTSNNSGMMQGGTPPDMPSGDNNGQSPDMEKANNDGSTENSNVKERRFGGPMMREDGSSDSSDTNKGQRGQRPGNRNSSDNSDSNDMTPPEKPDGENSEDGGTPPEMPNGEMTDRNMDGNMQGGFPGEQTTTESTSNISTVYYVVFGIESLLIGLTIMYLLMSNFNKKSFKETFSSMDKVLIVGLASVLITTGLTYTDGVVTKKFFTKNNTTTQSASTSSVKATGATTVTGKKTLKSTYESSTEDESAILVQNGGNATITNAMVNKKSGDSTNTENSEFYGVNAGILVKENSTATIKNSTIKTSAKGSNAVFSTGENSKIYISDTTITTTGESSSRGLDATYGGYIEADNVTITTQGGSCATLATDRGEGTVIAKNSKLETNGSGSPVIYSTGDISIENTTGTANGSQMVVIEGKNSATVTKSKLEASGKGNRGDTDQAGIMIYQSMSGDASEGTGTFTAKDSTLTIRKDSDYYKSAPMFFVTNTDAVVNLTNTKLNYGSNKLISIKGTDEWGKSGSNGGNLEFNATNQELIGNIEVDNISTLKLTLSKSTFKGTINADNSAKEITLKLDKNSKITLTGDSYVTSLEDENTDYSNIDFNGYKLYVNGKAIN